MALTASAPRNRRIAFPAHPILIALIGVVGLWLTMYVVVFPLDSLAHWNDFVSEAWAPYQLLAKGEFLRSLQMAPAYYGSLVLRAPLGVLGTVLSPNWGLAFLLSAGPCIASAPILGAWLTSERGPAAGAAPKWRLLSPLGLLLAVNPVFLFCIALGHPETVLSAVLAIVAVILAARGKTSTSMILIALAAFNQPWAIAVVPVAFAVLPGRRLRGLAVLGASLGLLYIPLTLIRTGGHAAASSLGSSVGQIFYPQQIWWWFGSRAWVSVHAHELILVAGAVCAAMWWLTHGRRALSPTERMREGLLLLALVLLLRTVMDPWNNLYYELPFLMTLYALYAERPPVLLLLVTGALFLLTMPISSIVDVSGTWPEGDVYAAAYQVVTVPMIVLLAIRLFAPAGAWARVRPFMAGILPTEGPSNGVERARPSTTWRFGLVAQSAAGADA